MDYKFILRQFNYIIMLLEQQLIYPIIILAEKIFMISDGSLTLGKNYIRRLFS